MRTEWPEKKELGAEAVTEPCHKQSVWDCGVGKRREPSRDHKAGDPGISSSEVREHTFHGA